MKEFLKISVMLLLCLLSVPGFAQERTVTGSVKDDEGVPLPGVTVLIKGSSTGTVTDFDGYFTLKVPHENTVLVFTYMGMESREITVGLQDNINISMTPQVVGLDDVVAIGYGRAKRKDISGSIATVDGETISRRNNTQLSQALQGTMPGVMVTRTNAEPGAGGTIRIRGITTIGDSAPLVIVDGVPVNSINDINAADIEDISVLKDAASASIYGARAASGVILVTTKRSGEEKSSLEYTMNYGFDIPTRFPDMVGPQRYLEMINEFTWNGAGNPEGGDYALYTEDEVNNWMANNATDPNRYPLTNWRKLIMNDYAPRSSHTIAFTGGSEKLRTRASLNYEQVDAMYDHKSFERFMGRVNNNFTISEKLKATIDVSYIHERRKAPVINPVQSAQRYPGVFAATWDDGRIAQGQNGSNIYARLHHGGFDNSWNNRLNSRMSLEYTPIENLNITGVFAPHIYNTKGKNFIKQIPYYDADNPTQFLGYIAGHNTTNLYESRNDGWTITNQLLVNYNTSLSDHNFDILAGYEGFSSFAESLNAQAENYSMSSFPYLDLAPLDYMRNSGGAVETAYRSFFGRLMYDYKGKYLLQANIRHDGSSRFHPDHRWGTFPSLSAGWVLTEENFMPEDSPLSYLKLKASWGQLGNERIGNYPYQSTIGFSNALFYQGNNVISGTTAAQFAYAIPNITWETTETTNIGLEAYFFKNRLMLTADYYKKTTRDMLLELEIPDYMGYGNPDQNTGKMYTTGWDLELAWRDQAGAFKYSISANLSDARSKMGDLGGIVFTGDQITRQGTEFNEWYGYLSDGLFQTAEDVANSPTLHTSVRPGDVKYRDISGPDGVPDGIISPDYDRVPLGGSLPRYIYGGNINMEYKKFDLTLGFQGVGKQKRRLTEQMVKPFFSAWTNAPAIIDGNYWSHYNTADQNLRARYPRLSYASAENNNYEMSDFWLIDGSYFRLKNIVLGYTLPESVTAAAKLSNARIFVSATDVFSIDKFPKGWDPEVADHTYMVSTFLLGVSVKF